MKLLSAVLTLYLSVYLILPGRRMRTRDPPNGRTERAVTQTELKHVPLLTSLWAKKGAKNCCLLGSPDLGDPQARAVGLWHPLWGSLVPGVSNLLGAAMFPLSKCGCPQQKPCVVHLVQPQPYMEPAPVPVPRAARRAPAASMSACALWPDPVLTHSHTPRRCAPGLPLAGVGCGLVV